MIDDLVLKTTPAGVVTAEEPEAWENFQAYFFEGVFQSAAAKASHLRALAKRRGKAKAKVVKPTKTGDQPRLHAQRLLLALDASFKSVVGRGLEMFSPSHEPALPVHDRPTLVLHSDEGPTGYAMAFYLLHHTRSRMVLIRDIYHREWNDVKNSLMESRLWWVSLLTRIPFNMSFGPWNGSKWWRVAQAGGKEVVAKESTTNPLFVSLYPHLSREGGEAPSWTPAHMKAVLQAVSFKPLVRKKGERVMLRRWFSWMKSAALHLQHWHSAVLIYYSVAMHLRLYKQARDTPWFVGRKDLHEKPGTEEAPETEGAEPEGAAEEREEAEGLEAAARAAADVDMRAEEEDKGQVNQDPESAEEVRRKAKTRYWHPWRSCARRV